MPAPLPRLWRAPTLALALLAACGSAPARPAHPPAVHTVRLGEAPTTTTSTTAPPPSTTTTAPWVAHAARQRAARVAAPAPSSTGGWPVVVGVAVSCMDNGPHSAELAHACWDGLIGRYPWPASTMFSVMLCESKGNPWNTGPPTRYGRARGLMQDMEGPYDPEANMALAYQKYSANGLGPWVSSRGCWG